MHHFVKVLKAIFIDKIFVFVILVLLGFALSFYLTLVRGTVSTFIEQMLHREQVAARAGANSIESFFELLGNALIITARRPMIKAFDEKSETVLNEFVSEWKETAFVEAILADREGKVISVANREDTEMKEGLSVKDRDYFIAAQSAQTGEVFIGNPILARFGAFEGEYIIPVSTPVIDDDELKGVLGGAVLLSTLTKNYLDPLKISENTNVYLVDSKGTFLYSTYTQELVGKNIFEFLEQNPFPGSGKLVTFLKDELEKSFEKKEGKIDFVRNDYFKKTELKRMLLSYSVIDMGDNGPIIKRDKHFILAVETPIDDVAIFYGPFITRQVIILILSLAVLFLFSLRLAIILGYKEREKGKRKINK